ncbi:hypothetical protein [Planctomycetes bacterium Poly30]|uniref:hypothetical protein n=1 Tax=Saltatorellus ferox TaxID=2528018 RepID=UPI0011A167CE
MGCSDSGSGSIEEPHLSASRGAGTGVSLAADASAIDRFFLQDSHQGGRATSFQLKSVAYGRIVELWGKNARGLDVRVARDFVIGTRYEGDGRAVRLVSQPVLGTDRLMIDEVVDAGWPGRARFLELAEAAAASVAPLSDAGASGAGTLTEVPRNAAFVLRFNDLVDPGSVSALGAMLRVGTPALAPFEARIASHELFGGIDAATGQFRSTRIVVDFTVSAAESERMAFSVPANPVGLPPAGRAGVPHAELRLPTVGLTGLSSPLRSSGGAPLGAGAGSIDFSSASVDLVRPFSIAPAGGAYSGFMMDQVAPRLVAESDVELAAAPEQLGMPDLFRLPRIQFPSPGCAGPAQPGDILIQLGVVAEVVADSGPATAAGLNNVMVRLLDFPATWTGPEQWETDGLGAAFYQAPYDVSMDDVRVACLVQVTPDPLGSPSAPTRGVDPAASFQLRFNEPIADSGEEELESVLITRTRIQPEGAFDARDAVVASGMSFGLSPYSGGYIVRPEVPLAHAAGASEVYYLTPRLGPHAVRDLAGNPLLESPGSIAMSIDPTADPVRSGGVLLGFEGPRELGNAGPDLGGQFQAAFGDSAVRPRPVIRFQGNVDNSNPVLAQQTRFPLGVQTPFNPLGARMQTLWRYCDMGFGLTDPNTINIDVEGLYWAPTGGAVVPDQFSGFEIKLAHSRFAPDEYIDPTSLFPQFQNSGLRPVYETNSLLSAAPSVVHPRQLGYLISPADVQTTPTGQALVPFPMNRVANEPKRTYTWRDSSLRERAGPQNAGVEPWSLFVATGLPIPPSAYFRTGEVRTIGLPLLLDFATFADFAANGQNGWDINLAVNSSSRPYFRAFSAGGVDTSGNSVVVDPSMETSANGGFSPFSNPPGAPTFGRDNAYMLGAADFVVRKSLAHTVWIDAGSVSLNRQFVQPIASGVAGQSPGVSVTVDVRGASEIAYSNSGLIDDNDGDENGIADMLEDASQIDLYGDYYNERDQSVLTHWERDENPGITFRSLSTTIESDEWRGNVNSIEGARYVQLRLTLESDIETGAVPAVGALGIAWTE